jgi:hypothetical protein
MNVVAEILTIGSVDSIVKFHSRVLALNSDA